MYVALVRVWPKSRVSGPNKVKAAKIQMQSFASALDLFHLDAGRYPSTSARAARLWDVSEKLAETPFN
jgi:hypothetical protein